MFQALLHRAWPRKDSYSRDVAYTLTANIFTAGLSVVSGILLARALGPVGRGQLAAIQAFPLILGSIGMLGLQDAIVFFGARRKERVGEYGVAATVLIFLIGIPIVFAGYWIIPLFLSQHTPDVVHSSRIYLGILFLNALMGFSVFTVRAVHDMPLWNFLRVLPQTTWVLVILGLFALERATPFSVAETYLAAFAVMSLLALLAIREPLRRGWRVRTAHWPPMLRYSLPLAAGSTPQVLGERIDQLIIAAVLPARDLGLYAVAVSWSLLMLLPGAALFGAAFSKIAGMQDPAEQWRFIRKVSWAVLGASVVAGAVLALSAGWIIPVVFGSDFAAAVPSAVILVLAAGIRNLARMLQVALKGVGKPSGIMFSEWGGVATLLIAIAALIPGLGLTGAAWSIVLSASAATTIAFVSLRRWAKRANGAKGTAT